jgi:hypothetical protein
MVACRGLYLALCFTCKSAQNRKPISELEPLTPAPATSVRSVVAERCRSLQNPHKKRVFCSLYCPLLQGIASGLGSRMSPTACCVLHRIAFAVMSKWC